MDNTRLIQLCLSIMLCVNTGLEEQIVYSARLVHRFSDEVMARISRNRGGGVYQSRRTSEYYRRLLSGDVQRQTLKLNPQFQYLYPSQGSQTLPLGNDFGWLHYMWIEIGTPKVSFLVALDAGSDLFWVPCECIQCAPLPSSYYSSLDIDLSEYNPSGSSTSKILSCSHQLCELGSHCLNPTEHCPYTINYYSDETSTSGVLVEDVLHLVPGDSESSNKSISALVVVGCGSKQTGGYLSGVAPDGLLGLGLGEISFLSFLAKAGYARNSFSLCFNEDDSGRLFFGDQGRVGQQTTPFLSFNGKNLTYIVGVDACCVGSSCLEQTNFDMLVDSGTSFTFLPNKIFERVASELDRQVNSPKSSFQGYPWQYCYKLNSDTVPKVPNLTLKFAKSDGFVISNPIFVIYGAQGAAGYCLALQPTDENIGTIGQNFMSGYQIVFDRENFQLGWSHSNCKDDLNFLGNGSATSLPSIEKQNPPTAHAIAPAVAGRTASGTRPPCRANIFLLLIIVLHIRTRFSLPY